MLMTVSDNGNMYDENNTNLMAMLNHLMNVKDSRWLQLEVCREFQRGQCSRSENECKFAHPPSYVEVQNGRVTACYDSIKGRCARENPKCKYLHPPSHLKDQLLINGRQNLAIKNLLMSQMSAPAMSTLSVAQLAVSGTSAIIPGMATPASAYNPYAYALNAHSMYPGLVVASSDTLGTVGGIINTGNHSNNTAAGASQVQKPAAAARSDRVEPMLTTIAGSTVVPSVQSSNNGAAYNTPRKRPMDVDISSAIDSSLLMAAAAAAMMQNKRTAYDKGGVPVFQPVAANAAPVGAMGAAFPYPHFATIQGLQTSYVPVTFSSPPPQNASGGNSASGASVASRSQSNVPVVVSPLLTQSRMSNESCSVVYFDESGKLLDTLPVCRDFKKKRCNRLNCRYVHLSNDYVEISDDYKVTVCRDFAKGTCTSPQCKLYHLPIFPTSSPSDHVVIANAQQQQQPTAPPAISADFANIALLNTVSDLPASADGCAGGVQSIPYLLRLADSSLFSRMVGMSPVLKPQEMLNNFDLQRNCYVVPSNVQSLYASYLNAAAQCSLNDCDVNSASSSSVGRSEGEGVFSFSPTTGQSLNNAQLKK